MATIWTARTRFLLIVAALLIAANVGRQGYRWFAFADERADLRRLSAKLEATALAVMRTQILADSLRRTIETVDAGLGGDRQELSRVERRAEGDGLPPLLYDEYRRGLERYNARVVTRNRDFERWREVVSRNHRAVDGYNALADSIRGLGNRMGEPYIAIPSPAEVAVRHGLDTASSSLAPPADAPPD
jgi:hypothetical protein